MAQRNAADLAEIEVTWSQATGLSAKTIYKMPDEQEFNAQVESPVSAGIVARYMGNRIYIPRRELAWSELDQDALRHFFPPETTLRLAWHRNAQRGSAQPLSRNRREQRNKRILRHRRAHDRRTD